MWNHSPEEVVGVGKGSWMAFPGYVLLFLMLVFPMVPKLLPVKGLLLAVTLIVVIFAILKTVRLALHPGVMLWAYVLAGLSFLFIVRGCFAGMTAAPDTIQIYVVWPILYVFMISGVRNERLLIGITKTILVSTCCIAVYSVLYTLSETHIFPAASKILLFRAEHQQFFLTKGLTRMAYPGLNSLEFGVPFCVAVLATVLFTDKGSVKWRAWAWAAVLLSPAAVLLSGRRALYLVAFLSPLTTLSLLLFRPSQERHRGVTVLFRLSVVAIAITIVSVTLLNVVFHLKWTAVTRNLTVAFHFTEGTSDNGAGARREEFHALAAGWMDNPILGTGYGVPALGSIRSNEDPSEYELAYMEQLYHTGIFGFAAYCAAICWIYVMGVRLIRGGGQLSSIVISTLVGLTSVLIVNATNPYFKSFETMWPVFVSLASVNYGLLRQRTVPLQPTRG